MKPIESPRKRVEEFSSDSFRFFPVVQDEVYGHRLHDADQAIDEVLTAVGRVKVQDFLDLTHLDRTYISLGVAVWAAVGKAKGFTPEFIMERLRRNCRINPDSKEGAKLEHPFDPVALKTEWLECFTTAEALMTTFPSEPIGCLYLDQTGQPARGKIFDPSWVPHYGSVKGAWPKIGE